MCKDVPIVSIGTQKHLIMKKSCDMETDVPIAFREKLNSQNMPRNGNRCPDRYHRETHIIRQIQLDMEKYVPIEIKETNVSL